MRNVTYPKTLTLCERNDVAQGGDAKGLPESPDADDEAPSRVFTMCTYALYAVVIHSGPSAQHGHYYAYARRSWHSAVSRDAADTDGGGDDDDDAWIQFNDR